MSWSDGDLAGVDTESTAKEPMDARMVTASVVIENPSTRIEPFRREWLVKVEVEIPEEAIRLHGVTNERSQADGRPLLQVIREVSIELDTIWRDSIPLVIYNAPYDLTLINQERVRCGAPPLKFTESTTPILDPLVIDRAMDKYRRGSRKLDAVCKHYGVTLDEAHTSAADSLAAVQVMRALVEAYPKLAQTSLQHLYRLQAVWCSQWASNYQSYLRDKASRDGCTDREILDITVDQAWPARVQVEGPMRVGGRQR